MEAKSRFSTYARAKLQTSRRFNCQFCMTAVVIGLAVLGMGTVYGQVDTANLDGEVLDPSLLAVPNATVNIENKATGGWTGRWPILSFLRLSKFPPADRLPS